MVPSRRRVNAFDHDVMAITVLDTLPVSGAVPRDGISELQASNKILHGKESRSGQHVREAVAKLWTISLKSVSLQVERSSERTHVDAL